MVLRILCILFTLFKISFGFSNQVYDTLYINKDALTIVAHTMQVTAFNDSSYWKPQSMVLELNIGDTLQLHIVNNDTLDHTFSIDELVTTGNTVTAGGTADFELTFDQEGAYRYYSDVAYGKLLGASGIIMYGYQNYARNYWNMFEQDDTLSQDIAALNVNATPLDYWPVIFTINMKVPPALDNDTLAKLTGSVGDTIIITVVNSGQMEHTLHFHGYHVEILQASINTKMIGWSKDTFPILIGEVMVLRLVPDQPGLYPVHEHNLINVSTNGAYPGGMLNLIEISP